MLTVIGAKGKAGRCTNCSKLAAITRGASLVVWAIRDGRDAAAGIHKYLEAKAQSALEAAE